MSHKYHEVICGYGWIDDKGRPSGHHYCGLQPGH